MDVSKKCSALCLAERIGPNSTFDPLCFNLPRPLMVGAFFRPQRGPDPNNCQFQATLHFLDSRRSVK